MKLPWSYSSLTKFEACPRQFYHLRVLKDVKDSPADARALGVEQHAALEARLRDKTPLPIDLAGYEPLATKLEAKGGTLFVEHTLALDSNLRTCKPHSTGNWVLCVMDALVVCKHNAVLLDWKTGRLRKGSRQLELSAAMVMSSQPEVSKVSTGYVWLAARRTTGETFRRADLPRIWSDFSARVARMKSAYEKNSWPASPSGLCAGWCPIGRERCRFWSPGKG